MTAVLIILAIIFVLALIGQAGKAKPNRPPLQRPGDPRTRPKTVDAILEGLHRDGVTLGYSTAWAHQVEIERERVSRFMKARGAVNFLHSAIGVLLALIPLAAAFDALPMLRNAAPQVEEWQWIAAPLGIFIVYRTLALAIAMPKDYMRFHRDSGVLEPQFERLGLEVKQAVASHQVEQLLDARVRFRNEFAAQYEAGEEKGRKEGFEAGHEAGVAEAQESAAAALAEAQQKAARALAEAVANARLEGKAEAVAAAERYFGARLTAELDKAYGEGLEAGRTEARLEAQAQLSGAYSRGRLDGEKDAMAAIHERLRTEREAGYQTGYSDGHTEGYFQGVSEGRNTARETGRRSRSPFPASPKTRDEALKLLELTAGASGAEIDQQFKRLRAAIHPDIVRGRKLPPVMVKYAEEHFKLLGEAYDLLTGVRA